MEIWYTQNDLEKIEHLNLLLTRLEINIHEIREDDKTILETKHKSRIREILSYNCNLYANLHQSYQSISKFSQDLLRNTSCLEYLVDIL